MLHYIENKSILFSMAIPFTILIGALGYFYYKSKAEVSIVESDQLDMPNEQLEEDDLYKDLEDLFI